MASRDYIKHFVSKTAPSSSSLGDEWFNPSTNTLYKRIANDGTAVVWAVLSPSAIPTATVDKLGLIKIGSNLLITADGVLSGVPPPQSGISTGKSIAMAIVFG